MCTTHDVTNHYDSWPGNHKEQSWSMKYALLTMSDNAAASLTAVLIQTGASSVSKHTHTHELCLYHTGWPRYTALSAVHTTYYSQYLPSVSVGHNKLAPYTALWENKIPYKNFTENNLSSNLSTTGELINIIIIYLKYYLVKGSDSKFPEELEEPKLIFGL